MAESLDPIPYCLSLHDAGSLALTITNFGVIGPLHDPGFWPDCVTGKTFVNGSDFPRGSGYRFLYHASVWVGGVLGGDTLVSTGSSSDYENELMPELIEGLPVRGRLPDSFDTSQSGAPVSHQDRLVLYTDTGTGIAPYPDFLEHRWHKPLNLEVYQESYVWSYRYSEDIVFFNLKIKNIGTATIEDAFAGVYLNPEVRLAATEGTPEHPLPSDDLCGYIFDFPALCGFHDTLNAAWFADNDGDPFSGEWIDKPIQDPVTQWIVASVRNGMGVTVLSLPHGTSTESFNWWSEGWPPGRLDYNPTRSDNTRDFRTGNGSIGRPSGDRNRYYQMSNRAIDFDQAYTGIMRQSSGWLLPDRDVADTVARGRTPHILLSQGPFRLPPGGTYNFAFCLFGAENFHTDPNNLANLPHNPDAYYANLDFSDLARNAVMAQKIYDNPGVDTDGDGYYGEYRICILDSTIVNGEWIYNKADTEWVKGDGIPDWRAATPPPSPDFWITPIHNGMHIRINGEVTEPAKDVLTQQVDFEGYNVYLARDSRLSSYSLVASCDLENWDIYVFNDLTEQWRIQEQPRSLADLRCRFGFPPDPCNDTTFHPDRYPDRSHYFPHPLYPESSFYFVPHGYNVTAISDSSGNLFDPDTPFDPAASVTPIRKRYPDYPDPRTLHPDSITPDMYTSDGYLKYYEYECEIRNLLPSVAYYFSVTAFDFGSPESGVNPLESDLVTVAQSGFPLHASDQPLSGSDKIYVYPNPYRTDAAYRDLGYEGREQDDRWDERVRAIWFANLPPKCTIHIFTIDGDRVRTLDHDMNPADPMHTHRKWDLINRNFQKVESGLYYWVVEIPGGETQIGKLAIIR